MLIYLLFSAVAVSKAQMDYNYPTLWNAATLVNTTVSIFYSCKPCMCPCSQREQGLMWRCLQVSYNDGGTSLKVIPCQYASTVELCMSCCQHAVAFQHVLQGRYHRACCANP